MAQYFCKQCNAQAKKEPCRKTPEAQSSLGTWGCPRCGNGVKVRREGTGQSKN